MRGALFSGVSFVLALYETFTASSPHYELIFGYMLVFAYGIFIILTRHKRPEYQETELQGDD
ncbi:MAG: hypothetical protein ACE5I1_01715 [bacterium]